MRISDIPLLIYQIKSWPISILIGSPGSEVIILCYRKRESVFIYSFLYVFYLAFVGKLRSMQSHNSKSLIFIFLIECFCLIKSPDTVDTSKCPKLYSYNLSSEFLERSYFFWVYPVFKSCEIWSWVSRSWNIGFHLRFEDVLWVEKRFWISIIMLTCTILTGSSFWSLLTRF